MIDSVACSAPDDAAGHRRVERVGARVGGHAASTRRDVAGAIVDMSMSSMPRRAAPSRPRAPKTTASTSGESGSIVMTTSAASATAAGESAAVAPGAASSSTAPRLRL